MPLRELAFIVAVAFALVAIAAPRFLLAKAEVREPALAQNLRLVEQAKDGFALERNLKPGTPVELDQLVRAGFLRAIPAMPPGLAIRPGKVGEAVRLDEVGPPKS